MTGTRFRRHPAGRSVPYALVLAAGCGGTGAGDDVVVGVAGPPAAPLAAVPVPSTTSPVAPTTAPVVADPWDVQPVAPRYQPTPVVLDAPDPVRVAVPAIGVDADLVGLGAEPDGTMEVPADPDAAGWYTGGARPGETGAAVVAGHVDSHTGPAVFHRLRDLVAGDEVVVTRTDGSRAVFTVGSVEEFPKDAFPTARVFGPVIDSELRLVTCGGEFDRATRSYRANVVAFASLTRVEAA